MTLRTVAVGTNLITRGLSPQMSSLPDLLRYSSDAEPGLSRRRRGSSFSYHDAQGQHISNEDVVNRIQLLALPPAYDDVWICLDEFGHLQATGRDEKGRKQYRYHADWLEFRQRQKFGRLPDFARALPRIRNKVSRDLRRDNVDLRFVSAALVRLIDRGALRIGNRRYEGDSYGASTLRTRHFKPTENGVQLDYTAKGGKRVRKTIRDKSLAAILEQIDDLPGRRLFQYINERGDVSRVDSADINAYLSEDFTAKTFRTWHGTVAAFKAAGQEKPTIKSLSEMAAKRLHNTPAICRSSYIHPSVIALAEMSDQERRSTLNALNPAPMRGLKIAERKCLQLLTD